MTCTIYLVRHAIAEPADGGMRDAERALTIAGQRKMARGVRGLKRLGVVPDLILTSPLIRAEQTADLLAAGLAPGCERGVLAELAPGRMPEDVVAALRPYRDETRLMLVGHQPDIGQLAVYLLTGASSSRGCRSKKALSQQSS